MIASICSYTSYCTCGATGCPGACPLPVVQHSESIRYSVIDSAIKSIEKTLFRYHIKKPSTDTINTKLQGLYIESTEPLVPVIIPYIRRLMFNKSGYLPKRIRRMRKGA